MAKSKKPRRPYRPRPSSRCDALGPIQRAAQAAIDRAPMSEDQARDLGIAYHLSLERMLKGTGDEEAWSTVTCSLNIALVLAERGIAADDVELLVRALEGAFRAKQRAAQTGRWAYDGDAIHDIREAFAVHDEQMRVALVGEVRAALNEVHRRIDAGNVYREAA
ncbi:hypothetical protein AQ938_06700 [Burkholderia pseudomallei]|nr:hypothetical protein DP47_3434 [Burkholderia pseudomallei Pasteur 52237]EDO95273.1 gp7 [Burkholderia pseudomallei Pasteur 52237]MWA16528.1 hypothetical protein [Burkholderia pseudomallei]OND78964.1 hypothetical protein AQ938_06700 [Burkholderia pseudomallei]VBQ81322.1 bacteriophage protein [Burkholderia pseudomallei]